MDDEVLDLVDKNDNVIGVVNRKDYDQLLSDGDRYIRAAELFIINSKGELWIPTRTAGKTIAPSGYDYSTAGHISTGEGYLEGLIREAHEEINLDISDKDVELIGHFRSDEHHYHRNLYLLRSDVEPNFNPDDFVSAAWLTPDDLIQNIDEGHPTKGMLRETVIELKKYLAK